MFWTGAAFQCQNRATAGDQGLQPPTITHEEGSSRVCADAALFTAPYHPRSPTLYNPICMASIFWDMNAKEVRKKQKLQARARRGSTVIPQIPVLLVYIIMDATPAVKTRIYDKDPGMPQRKRHPCIGTTVRGKKFQQSCRYCPVLHVLRDVQEVCLRTRMGLHWATLSGRMRARQEGRPPRPNHAVH